MGFNSEWFKEKVLQANLANFDELANGLFLHQSGANAVYSRFAELWGRTLKVDVAAGRVPFLPVELFKSAQVVTGEFEPETVFTSSATTGQIPSRHAVRYLGTYEASFEAGFRHRYGDPSEYILFALLPSYLERKGSSLVYMADKLIRGTGHPLSGFYLDSHAALAEQLKAASYTGKTVMLLGVTFALLDFAAAYPMNMPDLIVVETGGMKGRREEMTREEVHARLMSAFHVHAVHSEYGMTELLSQAWSSGNGLFAPPPWMRIIITDANDPYEVLPHGRTGVINIIDLANVDSCAFLRTSDLGKLHDASHFEVLGRLDHSDLRGCSLLAL